MANVQPVTDAAIAYGNQRAQEQLVEDQEQIEALQAQVAELEAALSECEGTDPSPEPGPNPEPEPGGFQRRGYITQQVGSTSNLRSYASQFANAKATCPAGNALSIRMQWKTYDADKGILAAGRDMADDIDVPGYAIRIMAGKGTPSNKMGKTITESGVTYPSPYGDTSGNPNGQFLDHLEATMREWAAFLDSTDEVNPVLHWTWYAKEWAEIYYGPGVQNAAGNTKTKFVAAQNAIIQRAADVQKDYPGVVMELPMSGHGPIMDMVDDMTQYAAEAFADNRAAIQANGWSYQGQWGQANPDLDEQMDACFDVASAQALGVGMQAIQPWGQPGTQYPQYTAAQANSAFAQADLAGADYFELYTPSWLSNNGGQVWKAPMAEWLEGTPGAASMSMERRRLRSIAAALGELLGYPDEGDPYYQG